MQNCAQGRHLLLILTWLLIASNRGVFIVLNHILTTLVAGASVTAQTLPSEGPTVPAAVAASAPALPMVIPRGTIVQVVIDDPLSSETSVPGQHFKLHSRIVVDAGANSMIAPGAAGEGEVVHAARRGGMGRSGELLVNARFLTCAGVRIPIGRLKIFTADADRSREALLVSAAVPLAGLLVKGGAVEIPSGAIGEARVMSDVAVPDPAVLSHCSASSSTRSE
jgi:hypothetical protein